MDNDQFDLTSVREDYDLEVKLAAGKYGRGKLPASVWETYSAFANTEGGWIVLGAKETKGSGEYEIRGVEDVDKVIKEFWDGANNPKQVSVNLLTNYDVRVQDCGGKKLIWIRVPQAYRKSRPVYLGANPLTGTYRRNLDGDYKCPPQVVKQMLGEQANETRDAVLLEHYGMDDISLPTLQAYRQRFAALKPDHPFNDNDNIEFLRNIGGWVQDRPTGKHGLSLAGILMFGRLRSILDAIPNYIVDYQERPRAVTELRWIDRLTTDFTWSGNLFDFYGAVIRKLFADLKVPFAMEGDTRIDDTPVHRALREALVNTLIHADYSGTCSLLVVKRPDLLGFRNPGTLRLPRQEVLRGGTTDCRNRGLQKMFQLVGLGEQAGSGMPKIFTGWESQHWKQPELKVEIESNQTILTLKMAALLPEETVAALKTELGNIFAVLPEIQRIAMVIAESDGCVTHSRLKELTKTHPHDLSVSLHDLVDKGLLESEGAGRGTFYYRPGKHPISDGELGVSFPPEQPTGNSHNNAPNSHNNAPNSPNMEDQRILVPVIGRKRVRPEMMEKVILDLCARNPRTIRELQALLQRTENAVRDYVIRMRRKGLNLTLKKIPKAVLRKCEWGKDDYSLEIRDLPPAPPEYMSAQESQETAIGRKPARIFGKGKGKDAGPSLFDWPDNEVSE